MANPVEISDVEARFLRPLSAAERTLGETLLGDAWEELLVRVPDLEARLDDSRVSQALLKRVAATMVVRVLHNPEAIRQWEVDGDSFTRDQAVSAGFLFATPDELALLRGTPSPAEGLPPIAFSGAYGGGWRR